jgi:DnaJ family protein C protein 19
MITTRATYSSSLRGVIAKRAAVVRQRTTSHQQKQRQQCERGLTTMTSNNNFFGGSIRDNNDGDNDDETKTKMKKPLNFFAMQQTTIQLKMQPRSTVADLSQRMYHTTPSPERTPAIIMGLMTLSAVGYAGSSAIKSYNEYKDAQPTKEELEEMRKQEEKDQANMNAQAQDEQQQKPKEEDNIDRDSNKSRTNIFREWFDVGTKYYEGGFEETMTRREAALILGVRESSSPLRVKDAHRRLLILNHPDTGGSTFLAGKLNEAKELLLKGISMKGSKNKNK